MVAVEDDRPNSSGTTVLPSLVPSSCGRGGEGGVKRTKIRMQRCYMSHVTAGSSAHVQLLLYLLQPHVTPNGIVTAF